MNDLNPLSQKFTLKSLLKFAFLTILMIIFRRLYTVVDTIFVARKMGTGEDARAAQDFTLMISAGILLGVLIAVLGMVFIDRTV